jgi:hypothetical protein
VAWRAVCATLGRELRTRYEVPQDLPLEMLALLVELDEGRKWNSPSQLAASSSALASINLLDQLRRFFAFSFPPKIQPPCGRFGS